MMTITTELAQPIVKRIIDVLDYNINIMNEDGVIVASADESRINQIHQGAIEVMKGKCERVIYPNGSEHMGSTKPGVNLPIEFQDDFIGTVGITGHPDDVYQTAKIVKITVEALLQQQFLSDRLRYKQKAVEQWVMDLIDPDFNNASEVNARSQILKIDLQRPSTILVMQIDKNNQANKSSFEKMQQQEASLLQLLNTICPDAIFSVHLGNGRFVMAIPDKQSNELDAIMAKAWHIHHKLDAKNWNNNIGVGFANQDVIGYRLSYKEALQSLEMLTKINPDKGAAHISEWGMLRFVLDVPQEVREAYISRMLKGKKQLSPELSDTLETFLECNQRIGETVAKLHIHRNTLLYRLERIKQLWDLDPRNFSDAMELQLIRLCLKLFAHSPVE